MTNDEIREDELVQEIDTEETVAEESVDWEAEALKAKAEAAKLNAILTRKNKREQKEPLQEQPIDEDITLTVKELKMAEDKRQFGYENGLSPAEVDAVFKNNPNPTKETLEDPFVKGGLAAVRSQNRVESNTPRTSSRSGSLSNLSQGKKPATQHEIQAAFEKKRDSFLNKR